MNNFEAKYIKLSSQYLSEKLEKLKVAPTHTDKIVSKKESKFKKLVSGIFK